MDDIRGQNMAGPWANCSHNLVRAHKMLTPRVQMALENVGSYQYLMYKRYWKNQTGPESNLRALNFSIPRALEIFALF